MRYITIEFKNAALCLSNKSTKDYVFDNLVYRNGGRWCKRQKHEKAKDTILMFNDESILDRLIGFEQVSNMLHVLCGCRPVPTYKETERKRVAVIDDATKNIWCKIDNTYFYTSKDGTRKPICDFTQAKKYVQNCNAKDVSTYASNGKIVPNDISWSRLERHYKYADPEKYKDILAHFEKWYGSKDFKKDYSLIDLLYHLAEDERLKTEMSDYFQEKALTSFKNIMDDNFGSISFTNADKSNNNYNLAKIVTNKAPLHKLYLTGKFILPVDNDVIFDGIMRGIRYATFLDGGLVSVSNTVVEDLDADYLGYKGFEQIFK